MGHLLAGSLGPPFNEGKLGRYGIHLTAIW